MECYSVLKRKKILSHGKTWMNPEDIPTVPRPFDRGKDSLFSTNGVGTTRCHMQRNKVKVLP